MQITDITVRLFRTTSQIIRDSEGHSHPGPSHASQQGILTIQTDEDCEGYALGSIPQRTLERLVKPMLVGENPFYRERIWQALKERQRLNLGSLGDRILALVDIALWDLAGRALGQPVYRLLGAYRDKVPAYASTMCGDDLEDPMDEEGYVHVSPEPGLGWDIDFEYVCEHLVTSY